MCNSNLLSVKPYSAAKAEKSCKVYNRRNIYCQLIALNTRNAKLSFY
jgi:hypothetical protein